MSGMLIMFLSSGGQFSPVQALAVELEASMRAAVSSADSAMGSGSDAYSMARRTLMWRVCHPVEQVYHPKEHGIDSIREVSERERIKVIGGTLRLPVGVGWVPIPERQGSSAQRGEREKKRRKIVCGKRL